MSRYDTRDTKATTIVRALAEAGYDDVLLLDREGMAEVFTDRRTELVELIAESDGLAVGELADELGRKQPAVSRDLDVLFKYSVVDYEKDGRRKIPSLRHETILQKPIV